jgi:hypothetical protein
MEGNKEQPAETPAGEDEIAEHMSKLDVRPAVIVGYVLPVIVLWLMSTGLFSGAIYPEARWTLQ